MEKSVSLNHSDSQDSIDSNDSVSVTIVPMNSSSGLSSSTLSHSRPVKNALVPVDDDEKSEKLEARYHFYFIINCL